MHVELSSATPDRLLDEGFSAALIARDVDDDHEFEIHRR
jgi:hypothetical protein